MLNKEEVERIKDIVKKVDINKAIQDAIDMGIEITEPKRGYHGIYNELGNIERLDIDKYLTFGKKDN